MLLQELLKIADKILSVTMLSHLEIVEAKEPCFGEIDPKTDELIEESLRAEYDLIVSENENVSHQELLEIHEILEPYPHIEMRLHDGKLEIFSRYGTAEEATKEEA